MVSYTLFTQYGITCETSIFNSFMAGTAEKGCILKNIATET